MDVGFRSIGVIIITCILGLFPKDAYAKIVFETNALQSEIDSLAELAKTHHSWAAKHYKVHGLLDSVIYRARLALEIRERLWKDNPNIDLGKSYHNLGTFLKMKGEYKEAKKYLKEAVSVYTELKHDRLLRSLLELGKIYKQEGDYVSAEEYFKHVIQVAEESNNDNKIRAAVVDLGSIYLESYQDSVAIHFLEKYTDYFDVANENDKDNIGRFYNNLASVYMRNDKFDKAIRTYQKASRIDKSNYKTQAQIYLNLAIPYRLKKMYRECQNAIKKGQELAYESKDVQIMSFSHKSMAKYYEAQSQLDLALMEYQKAIQLLLPVFTPSDQFDNPTEKDLSYVLNKSYLLSFLSDKVKVVAQLGREKYKKEILELFKLGDLVIDDLRSDHFINETKLYWRSVAFPFYEEALKYCHEENENEDAFYFFEKSKSVLLLEGYSFNDAISKLNEKNKLKYYNLKDLLNRAQSEDNDVNEMVHAQRDFETFMDSLTITYPHLFKGYNDLLLMSLSEFQKEFVDSASMIFIHYFHGKENVFAFGIGEKDITFMNLGSVNKIDSLISELNYFFHHPAQIDNNFDAYKKLSKGLYELILSPLVKDTDRDVVISPDGPISSIPFESLISSHSDKNEIEYVIQNRSIRYAFSGSILSNMNDSDDRGKYDVMTFIPFSDDEKLGNSNFSGVTREDFAASDGLNVKYYLGEDATMNSLTSIEGRLPILHFSSHGFEDADTEPRILLYNSSISLSELYTSFLPSDMVFLSACRTSLGKNSYGEGIQSMARGFTFAGANSVVASLWNVVADPNSKIVRRFYQNLSKGETKHMALHNAKLTYLQDPNVPLFEKSPYYWAGLVYYGEADHILKPERKSKAFNIPIVLTILVIFIVMVLGIRRYKMAS